MFNIRKSLILTIIIFHFNCHAQLAFLKQNDIDSYNILLKEYQSSLLKGANPLILAIEYEQLDAAKKLLQNGADPNTIVDRNTQKTLLIFALETGSRESVVLLLENNASVDQADAMGTTPLLYALKIHEHNAIKLLTSKGANIFTQNIDAKSPLNYALKKHSNVDVIKDLLVYGLDLSNKECALVYGCTLGDRSLVSKLIKEKVDPNTLIAYIPPIMYVAFFRHINLIPLLVANGADINSNEYGTALYWLKRGIASKQYYFKDFEVEQLIKVLQLKDIQEYFKCSKDIKLRHKELIKSNIYPRFENKQTILMLLALENDIDSLREFVKLKLPLWYINAKDESGYTALMYATKVSNFESITELLKYTDKGVWLKNKYGITSLEYAALYNNLSCIVNILESNKIHIPVLKRALNIALNEGNAKIVSYIVSKLILLCKHYQLKMA